MGFNKHNYPKINIFEKHRKKMLDEKISFYRNVFLLQYREQKCLVCNGPLCFLGESQLFYFSLFLLRREREHLREQLDSVRRTQWCDKKITR